ncbi:histone-lysine N-methyltransferase SETMAR [Trichonephila clavipes]|nr:histone-lysine N-methyltransferase SETMAR [Trichonephila clavipes]
MGECLSSIKHVVGRFTVARRLHGGGLFARRPVRCVPLTPAHRRRRSLWRREHRNCRDNEWGRVLFTDESRFSLSSDSHRILIWRERGSRNHPSNIIERDRYGGRGVLVWGGIMLGSRTDLHIFDAGSVNGTRYCNEILLPYVRLFRGAMGLQFLFMDNNAPCHRTVAAKQLLESEDIEPMDWSARSPDLNPIEHVWDFLGRRLAARTLPPVTIRELRLALQEKGKNAVQARKKLTDVCREVVLRVCQCQNCFAKFRSSNFDVEDAPRSGRPVEAEKDAIKALVDANRRITTREIGLRLNLSNSTVYDHWKGLGLLSKLNVWFPHVLTERNLCRRIDVCDSLLKRHENDPFLMRIITGAKKGHGAKKMNRLKSFPKPIFTKKRKGKNAVQASKKLTDLYGEGVLTVRQCQNWFAKFRSGNFDVEDAPRSGRPIEADEDAIKALVDANRRITTREIGLRLNLSNSTV